MTTEPKWRHSFIFDGFGNLTAHIVTKGTAPTVLLGINPADNLIASSRFGYDANDNLTSA